jgi:hypothetical protein
MAPPITPSSPSPVQPLSIALYISDGLIFELYNGRRPTPQSPNQLGKGSRQSQLKRDERVHSRRRSASTRELPIPLRSNVHGVFISLRIRFRFDGKCSLHIPVITQKPMAARSIRTARGASRSMSSRCTPESQERRQKRERVYRTTSGSTG